MGIRQSLSPCCTHRWLRVRREQSWWCHRRRCKPQKPAPSLGRRHRCIEAVDSLLQQPAHLLCDLAKSRLLGRLNQRPRVHRVHDDGARSIGIAAHHDVAAAVPPVDSRRLLGERTAGCRHRESGIPRCPHPPCFSTSPARQSRSARQNPEQPGFVGFAAPHSRTKCAAWSKMKYPIVNFSLGNRCLEGFGAAAVAASAPAGDRQRIQHPTL